MSTHASEGQADDETGTDVALTRTHADRVDFEEDTTLLSILYNRVFRWAINLDAPLSEPPDIEKEAGEVVPELTAAVEDLDRAREGITDVHTAIAQWGEELVASG